MKTTDKELIYRAVALIAGEDAFIPLRKEDFADVCPAPSWAVHVSGEGADDILERLRLELADAGARKPDGVVAYVRTASMTLAELARIDGLLPRARRVRKGIAFLADGADTDVWIFADAGRDKEDSQ